MKHAIVTALLLSLLCNTAQASFFDDDAPPASVAGSGVSFDAAFTPGAAFSPAVVKMITAAKKSIRMSARDFTSKPVSEALLKASRAGIDVKILLNKKTNLGVYSAAKFLMTMSLTPHVMKSEDALYADYIVLDEQDIILGNSASFVDEEEEKKNAASLLIIHNAPELAKRYLAQWQSLWDNSEAMKPDKN